MGYVYARLLTVGLIPLTHTTWGGGLSVLVMRNNYLLTYDSYVPLLCGAHTVVLYCDGDFNWLGQVLVGGGGGRFDPSLAVR